MLKNKILKKFTDNLDKEETVRLLGEKLYENHTYLQENNISEQKIKAAKKRNVSKTNRKKGKKALIRTTKKPTSRKNKKSDKENLRVKLKQKRKNFLN